MSLTHWYDWFLFRTPQQPQTPGNGESDPSIAENQHTWVTRCRNGAIVVTILWIVWIVIVQYAMRDSFPDSWYISTPDQAEYTGW